MGVTVEWIAPDGAETPLADLANHLLLLGPFTGVGVPPILHTSQAVNDEQGEWWQNTRYDKRDVTIGAALVCSMEGAAALRALLRNLARQFNPLRGMGILRFTDTDTRAAGSGGGSEMFPAAGGAATAVQRELHCRYAGGLSPDILSPDDWSDEDWYEVTLAFRAFDPWFYDAVDSSVSFGTSGSAIPFFPLFADAGDVGPHFGVSTVFSDVTIANIGDGNAWPVITITGPGSGIILTNDSTQQTLNLTANGGVTLGIGDVLTIDTRPGAKTLTVVAADGITTTNVFDRMTDDSMLWALDTGDNVLSITMAGANEQSDVTLTWRARYSTL